jgi:sterol desaturase/sphingolipid hydroxylase (fatty acid hydroxylase superfamily)
MAMRLLLSDQGRLVVLVSLCGVLWALESIIPLYRYRTGRLRHALPNVALTVLLVLTNLVLSFGSAGLAAWAGERRIGLLFLCPLPPAAQVLVGVVTLDLLAYFAHLLLHKTGLGWRFHRVHHCDARVDVTTAFRQHPGETVWRMSWQLAGTLVLGLPLWAVVVYLVLSTMNAELEHANLRVSGPVDAWIRRVFVTPDMHKVHHSRDRRETDSNYSNIFSLWDRLFGTYTGRVDFGRLSYGLDGFDGRRAETLRGLLGLPFGAGH